MTTKYNRSLSSISRDTTAIETQSKDPAWFNDFVSNLEKSSVHTKKELSTFEQISQILGNKGKYSTVEEAVLDMQKRTGLYDYIRTKAATSDVNDASKHRKHPELFKSIPELQTFIDNHVETRPGTSPDAVVYELLRLQHIKEQLPESDDVPDDVKQYISDKILEAKQNSPQRDKNELGLGKIDLTTDTNTAKDNNPFGGCEPARDV